MGLGFKRDRSQHGSGSPINDWDPAVMEEDDVMLDLSGYTYLGSISSSGKTIVGDTVIFCKWIGSNGETAQVHYNDTPFFVLSSNTEWQDFFKFRFDTPNGTLKTTSNSYTILAWSKQS